MTNVGLLGWPIGTSDNTGPREFAQGPTGTATGPFGFMAGGRFAPDDPMRDAFLFLDANLHDGGVRWRNLGVAGSALDAVLTAPLFLRPSPEGTYFYQPGTANSTNYMAFPDDGTTFTGDMSIAVRFDPDNRATQTTLVLKRSAAIDGALVPFNFVQGLTAGAIGFTWYDSVGTVHQLYTATLIPVAAKWVGVQHDIDNGAGGNTATFYWSNDGVAWTLLATVTEAALATRRVNTGQIGIAGTDAGVAGTAGKYYEVKMWNSLTFAGTPQRHIRCSTDISSEAAVSFTATSGQTVTIARSTTGFRAEVVMPTGLRRLMFGGTNFSAIPLTEHFRFGRSRFTVMAVFRQWPTQAGAFRTIMCTIPNIGSTDGWGLHGTSGEGTIHFRIHYSGNGPAVSIPVTAGALTVLAGIRERQTLMRLRANATTATAAMQDLPVLLTDSASASILGMRSVQTGRNHQGGQAWEGVLFGLAAWNRALSAREWSQVTARWGVAG